MNKILKSLSKFRRRNKYKKFYRKFIKQDDLCFDIGANVGNRTAVFLSLGANVVSVEPVKETCDILKEKFKANKRVTILQTAIGSKIGEKDIYISNYSEVSTLSEAFIEKYKVQKKYNVEWNSSRVTKVDTIDNLISEYGVPAFCKIDVEGYEKEVLEGLSQPIPMLSFEYNVKLKNLALECVNALSKFENLTFNFSPYESMQYTLNAWLDRKAFYNYLSELPNDILTGDVYVKHN